MNATWVSVEHCRACGSTALGQVLNLGTLAQAGTFPSMEETAAELPLSMCHCGACGLLQLEHMYSKGLFFEEGYGYRSGLNPTMRDHLESVAQDLCERFPLRTKDSVMDIGANDGTFLAGLPDNVFKIAIDPGMDQYQHYYGKVRALGLLKIKGYFPDLPNQLASQNGIQLISSIAMFYDVDTPFDFMNHVRLLLAKDGIWYCEMAYAATMIQKGLYDAICHEHACYYTIEPLLRLANRAGLKIIDFSFNGINGGSVALIFAREDSKYERVSAEFLLRRENGMVSQDRLNQFRAQALAHMRNVHDLVTDLVVDQKKKVYGIGASTKGNVLLQCAKLSALVKQIGEVNPDKWDRRTPGTHIPIVRESDVMLRNPDVLLILPWHFREFMVDKFAEFVLAGGKLLFPFPTPEVWP